MATKTSAKKPNHSAATPDAIKLLTEEHREVHALFAKYQKLADAEADGSDRQALAEQITTTPRSRFWANT